MEMETRATVSMSFIRLLVLLRKSVFKRCFIDCDLSQEDTTFILTASSSTSSHCCNESTALELELMSLS